MIKHTTYIEVGNDKIINLDADDQGNFIAFTDKKAVLTKDHNLRIDLEIRFPIIRRLIM